MNCNSDFGLSKEQRREFFSVGIQGNNLDVDEILASAPFAFDSVSRKGDQKRYSCIPAKLKDSSLSISLGDPCGINLPDQVDIAYNFLREHYDYLHDLFERDDIDRFYLDLSPTLRIDRATCIAGHFLSRNLVNIAACLRMTIALNIVPYVEEWEE